MSAIKSRRPSELKPTIAMMADGHGASERTNHATGSFREHEQRAQEPSLRLFYDFER